MSAPSRPTHRPWEPEALELPLEPPRRSPRAPNQVTVPSVEGDLPVSDDRAERVGSYVVVIDIS